MPEATNAACKSDEAARVATGLGYKSITQIGLNKSPTHGRRLIGTEISRSPTIRDIFPEDNKSSKSRINNNGYSRWIRIANAVAKQDPTSCRK
ncbi:Uncharacterised protein [Chlamydia trachomatis]|nr:Uncharacterised protein [Chlamydia trachomatis]CRH87243.1 Uncharacterised protein [Chlamydia trachomatis]